MQSLSGLYFPETILPRHLRNALLLLPDTLHSLQAVEADPTTQDHTPGHDIFMEQGICQAHTPSPLGTERARFLTLMAEISAGKDGFAEQLSSLTLAHLSQTPNNEEQNHHAIKNCLVDPQPCPKKDEGLVWQARLVLALAEILDREELELAVSLADIDEHEVALFLELKGEGEINPLEPDPFAELMHLKSHLSQPRPGTIKRRLEAWKTLYGSGPLPHEFGIWIATQEEAAELLIASYEAQTGRNAVPLILLTLPEEIPMGDEDALAQIDIFKDMAKDIRPRLIQQLTSITNQGPLDIVDPVALLPDAGTLSRDWNDCIEYCFPEKRFGRKQLELQLLANSSLDQLIRGSETAPKGQGFHHGIVALYRD